MGKAGSKRFLVIFYSVWILMAVLCGYIWYRMTIKRQLNHYDLHPGTVVVEQTNLFYIDNEMYVCELSKGDTVWEFYTPSKNEVCVETHSIPNIGEYTKYIDLDATEISKLDKDGTRHELDKNELTNWFRNLSSLRIWGADVYVNAITRIAHDSEDNDIVLVEGYTVSGNYEGTIRMLDRYPSIPVEYTDYVERYENDLSLMRKDGLMSVGVTAIVFLVFTIPAVILSLSPKLRRGLIVYGIGIFVFASLITLSCDYLFLHCR